MPTNKATKQLVIAKAQHALSSPRKTNLVLKAIVGRPALLAIKQLSVIPKRAAEPILQLVKQAVGNAVSQFQASPDRLVIDSAFATKGRVLKRAHIGGRGKTKPYERTTSHLTLFVRVLPPLVPKSVAKSAPVIPSVVEESHSTKEVVKKVVKLTKKSK